MPKTWESRTFIGGLKVAGSTPHFTASLHFTSLHFTSLHRRQHLHEDPIEDQRDGSHYRAQQ